MAMFRMIGVFAEFERTIIQERIKAGLVPVHERKWPRLDSPCRKH